MRSQARGKAGEIQARGKAGEAGEIQARGKAGEADEIQARGKAGEIQARGKAGEAGEIQAGVGNGRSVWRRKLESLVRTYRTIWQRVSEQEGFKYWPDW